MKEIKESNYFRKIRGLLPPQKFRDIEGLLSTETNERLEAFWNILIAGYPVDFVLNNYEQLYEYLTDKLIDYSDALVTYVIYPELTSGIYITKTKWFELN